MTFRPVNFFSGIHIALFGAMNNISLRMRHPDLWTGSRPLTTILSTIPVYDMVFFVLYVMCRRRIK